MSEQPKAFVDISELHIAEGGHDAVCNYIGLMIEEGADPNSLGMRFMALLKEAAEMNRQDPTGPIRIRQAMTGRRVDIRPG